MDGFESEIKHKIKIVLYTLLSHKFHEAYYARKYLLGFGFVDIFNDEEVKIYKFKFKCCVQNSIKSHR